MGINLHPLLSGGLAELSLSATRAQVEALLALAGLLVEWAKRINLTGHRAEEQVVRRLILDAAALFTVLPPFKSLADLGSGAGFPGLPIAVLAPDCTVRLIEARRRRHHFQREAIRTLALDNVEAVHGRAESLVPQPSDIVIAQAVGPPDQVLGWMLPWASRGGSLAIPGSARSSWHAAGHAKRPGLSEVRVRAYRVPLGGPDRTVWLGRRSAGEPHEAL